MDPLLDFMIDTGYIRNVRLGSELGSVMHPYPVEFGSRSGYRSKVFLEDIHGTEYHPCPNLVATTYRR